MSAAARVVAPAREEGRADGELAARLQVSEIQRSRLLAAAVRVIDEDGYGETTVARITNRAHTSRRTFYELFHDREDCLSAVLENALGLIEKEIAAAELDGLEWRERVRSGLWAILSFFDREPALARVCVVQSLHGGQGILERRALVLSRSASVIDEGRQEGQCGADAPSLTAEGLVGAAHGIVHERLLRRSREPLTSLFGSLMAMIVLPYLGAAAARREQARSTPQPANEVVGGDVGPLSADDPLEGIPMRVTYRTARVLACIAEHPGISNRTIGDRAGIPDQGQISKLLARLQRLGLAVANRGEGHVKGEPNAWTLTPTGSQVEQSIRAHTHVPISQGENA
jgi:AcrR family transcriptional regulator